MIGQCEFAAAIGDWSLVPADPRFRIYRNNVTSALINALRVRYPVTERLLGREAFAAMRRILCRDTTPRIAGAHRLWRQFPRPSRRGVS